MAAPDVLLLYMHSSSKTTTRATPGSLPSGGEPNYSFPASLPSHCGGKFGRKAIALSDASPNSSFSSPRNRGSRCTTDWYP